MRVKILQTKLPQRTTQLHIVLLCLYVADPATFQASNSVLEAYFHLTTACLFSYGQKKNISEFILLPH